MNSMHESPNDFFVELLAETEVQFKESPVHAKQKKEGKEWNYAVCATPIVKGKGVIFGINWGGDNKLAQTEMPIGNKISDYHFIRQNRALLEKYWELNNMTADVRKLELLFLNAINENDTSKFSKSVHRSYFDCLMLYIVLIRYVIF